MSAEPLLEALQPPDPPEALDDAAERSWPATLLASVTLSACVFGTLALPAAWATPGLLGLLAVAPLVLLGVIVVRWTFDSRSVRRSGRLSAGVLAATVLPTCLGVGVASGAGALLGAPQSLTGVLASLGLTPAVLVAAAAVRAVEVRYLRASRRVFLVATTAQHADVVREIRRDSGMALVGFVNAARIDALRPDRAQLAREFEQSGASMLVLARQAAYDTAVVSAASVFNLAGGRVRDLGSFYERHFGKTPLSELTPSWFLFDIAEIHRARVYGVAKRAADVAISAALLLAAAPALALVALLVKLSSPGPVLFRQDRVGKGGAVFSLVKFRTMAAADPAAPHGWAGDHAHRITPVGRFLRRYRLDELPQLWTIVRGDMSLVGPRPEQAALVAQLKQSIEFYDARHSVRPGLTGWAQVNSGYGGSHQGTLEKLQYDFYYIRHQRLRLDLLVLVRTLKAVVNGRGSA